MDTNALLLFLIEAATQIRLFHWQTEGYAEHKALGDLYGVLESTTDDIAEALIGATGQRPIFKKATIELSDYAEGLPAAYLAEMDKQLASVKDLPTDILNLRDSVLEKVHRTLYLLTLE